MIGPGAVLLIIFVNDLPLAVSRSIVDIYADDTTLSAPAAVSDLLAVQQQLQEDINRIADCTSENRIVLNTSKTKTLLVTGKRLERKISNKALKIACNGNEIEQVTSQKLDLTFKQHVSSICKKVNNQFSVMTRFGKLMSTKTMLRLYKVFILPHFYYCSMVRHFSSKHDSDKLDLLNKRIPRFLFKDFNSEYNNLLKKAGTANLKDKRLQNMILTIFKYLHFSGYPRCSVTRFPSHVTFSLLCNIA